MLMGNHGKPVKPNSTNDEFRDRMWDFMEHLNDRIDKIYVFGGTIGVAIIAGLVGLLVK